MAVSVQWWMNARSVTKFGWLVNIRSMHELNDREKWVGFFIICDFAILRPSWVGLSSEHQLLCFALKSPKKNC